VANTQYSIQVIKTITRRGDPLQTWSNRYHFDGGAPADEAAWTALADALVAIERACYSTNVQVIKARGYPPGTTAVAVFNKTYALAGTASSVGGGYATSDSAAVLRQATTKLSRKNHTVYCMSYFHGAMVANATSPDTLLPSQKTAIESFGNVWVSGLTVGARTYKRTTPDGALVTGAHCDVWVGHRDFPH
jgi:hypothetical protein